MSVSDDFVLRFKESPPRRIGNPRERWRLPRNLRAVRVLQVIQILVVAVAASGMAGCKKKVIVPDVARQDLVQAGQTLTAASLKVGTVSGVPPGTKTAYVRSQTPAAGQQIAADSAVDLVASLPVTVPDLTKSTLTGAVSTLQDLGLRVAFIKQPTMNILSGGRVRQQAPAANSPVAPDTVVTLTVSAPPDLGALLGLVNRDPAYANLNPEYRKVLDKFLSPSN